MVSWWRTLLSEATKSIITACTARGCFEGILVGVGWGFLYFGEARVDNTQVSGKSVLHTEVPSTLQRLGLCLALVSLYPITKEH